MSILEKERMLNINRALNYRYKRKGQEPFNATKSQNYWTARGATVRFCPDQRIVRLNPDRCTEMWIENTLRKHLVEEFRKNARLIAAKKASEQIFPEN
ncbi:hypothetical protein COB21_04365 [Candidatus Aerophobetes bacterium]|uniref:Uncharacterized protein n=1 Tax=Aerophobetes bacterium TaxID=2030807 RepID=A0A2A4X1Q6_UNCAE|nr:MAG: hypothetical protein COB21_04365 [Candidatus Aerophobetes bacterium]